MNAADRADPAPAATRGCSCVDRATATHRARCRARLGRLPAAGRPRVANDAATLPASLRGVHVRSGARDRGAAGRPALARADDVREFTAVVFGAGDSPHAHRRPRRRRRRCAPGDRLALGPLAATVAALARPSAPRRAALRRRTPDAIWAGIARHGRPIQYAHLPTPLALWDVWTRDRRAAGRVRAAVGGLRARLAPARRRCGDAASASPRSRTPPASRRPATPRSMRRLPFDEPYRIPAPRSRAIRERAARGGRVVALGTTVVRALEHAARAAAAFAPATGWRRSGSAARRRCAVVDAIVSGTHEPGTQPLRVAARVRRRRRAGRADAAARGARLPHARVRRLGPGSSTWRSQVAGSRPAHERGALPACDLPSREHNDKSPSPAPG